MTELSLWPSREESHGNELENKTLLTYHLLKQGEVYGQEEIHKGANRPLIVTLSKFINGKTEFLRALAKPVSRENTSSRGEIAYSRYELASTWVAKALGFAAYPLSCLRKLEIDGQFGETFLQQYIDAPLLVTRQGNHIEGMEEMMIFDFLIWNKDRHYSNALVENNTVIPIDHGKSFSPDVVKDNNVETLKLIVSNLDWKMLKGKISPNMQKAIHELARSDSKLREILGKKLSFLITAEEQEAFWGRLELVNQMLVKDGDVSNLITHMLTFGIDIKDLYKGKLSQGDDQLSGVRMFARNATRD